MVSPKIAFYVDCLMPLSLIGLKDGENVVIAANEGDRNLSDITLKNVDPILSVKDFPESLEKGEAKHFRVILALPKDVKEEILPKFEIEAKYYVGKKGSGKYE